jgi:hypothetical protein
MSEIWDNIWGTLKMPNILLFFKIIMKNFIEALHYPANIIYDKICGIGIV